MQPSSHRRLLQRAAQRERRAFAAGVLQYVRSTLDELLQILPAPPRHVLVNRLPLTMDRRSFVTLQNGGADIQAYRIAND
ncbi:MAG TPA: hypothetical protein VLA16_18195, partial [Ideonella sp.]|nr:hypothetical protein [Ideonella sp.]